MTPMCDATALMLEIPESKLVFGRPFVDLLMRQRCSMVDMFTPNSIDPPTAIIDSIFLFINFPFDYNRTAINPPWP